NEDDAVRNSPRVHREFDEGVGNLPGWHKGVHRKKTKTHRKIVGGSQKACQELEGSDDTIGPRREFARRFTEEIGKLVGNTSGDRQKKSRRLASRMSEAVKLVGWLIVAESPRTGRQTAHTWFSSG
ncbi:hypothetical protein B296_00057871, partial [Ensete ventricosum]